LDTGETREEMTIREEELYRWYKQRMSGSLTPSLEICYIASTLGIEEAEVWSAVRIGMNEESKRNRQKMLQEWGRKGGKA